MTSIAIIILSPYLIPIYLLARLGLHDSKRRIIGCLTIFLIALPVGIFDLMGVTFYNPTVGGIQTVYPSVPELTLITFVFLLMFVDLLRQSYLLHHTKVN